MKLDRIKRLACVSGALAAATVFAPVISPAQAQGSKSFVIIGRGSSGSTSDLAFTVLEEALKRSYPGETINIRRGPNRSTAVSAAKPKPNPVSARNDRANETVLTWSPRTSRR